MTAALKHNTRQEATDVLHFLLPQLESAGIPIINIKVDRTTKETGALRGDVWISREPFTSPQWEKQIVGLIEAKSPDANPGTPEWQDAIRQGKEKARRKKLATFAVTNTQTFWRYYRSDGKEITLNGIVPGHALSIPELEILQTQIGPSCVDAKTVIVAGARLYSQKDFVSALEELKDVYRSCAIGGSKDQIVCTISFVMLKYITEQESWRRSFPPEVMLWDDWRATNMDRDVAATIEDVGKHVRYSDISGALSLPEQLSSHTCKQIHDILSPFQFSGCNFDLYGAVYESFADKNTKEAFGQYYTRRHITNLLAELMLRSETKPRGLKICDPACGTGGFLTEAYRILLRNYTESGTLSHQIMSELSGSTFFGYDLEHSNISLARINMCLAGDGHAHIEYTNDSLMTLPQKCFDYVLTNVPYGKYKGAADITIFSYSKRRESQTLFLEKVVKALVPGGRAAVIVPDGTLESPSLENFRINLLNDVQVEAIVSFHPYVFRPYTTEKTYAIILRRLAEYEIGEQGGEIFMYILENDGFQKGDKRYPIRENCIPDLLEHYGSTLAEGRHIFVPRRNINAGNFHNLTPEFYLGYYEEDYLDVSSQEYDSALEKMRERNRAIEKLASKYD